jgi:hypothetical protein
MAVYIYQMMMVFLVMIREKNFAASSPLKALISDEVEN